MVNRIALLLFIGLIFGQDDSIIGSNDVQYQEQAKADAMEDFDSRLKWLGISTAAFIGGLYVGDGIIRWTKVGLWGVRLHL